MPTSLLAFTCCLRRCGRLVVALACTSAIPLSASSAEIWVVTDRQRPVTTAAGVRFIELDAPRRIHDELAAQLPSDPERAAAIVRKRLKAGGDALHRRLASAYQGITDAWSLGVTQLPAVIVDRRYVVYGEPDVNRAIALIDHYRSSPP